MAKNNNTGKWGRVYRCFLWELPGLVTFFLLDFLLPRWDSAGTGRRWG
jgi:hypothetical protein